MNKGTVEPDYIERGDAMTAQKRAAILQILTNQYAELKQLAATDKFTTVRGANLAREMGEQIELFTGHEKLLPAQFQPLAVALPKSAGIELAKECLAIFHRHRQPITEYAEAAVVWERMRVQLELLPKGSRGEAAGEPPLSEPVKEAISDVIRVAQVFLKLNAKNPVETWPPFLRKQLLTQGRPFHEVYERAQALEAGSTGGGEG